MRKFFCAAQAALVLLRACLWAAPVLATPVLATPVLANEDELSAWRLFVSDHAEPVVDVFDALDGDKLATFRIKGPASLYRTESGQTVFAVQGAAGAVSAISTGMIFHDHGDHGDIGVGDPELLDVTLEGSRPAHFVERQGNVAQWFDGEGKARFFTEKAALEGRPQLREIGVAAPHHGVAVPFDSHAVITIPDPEDASRRPIGARLVDLDGNRIGEDVACPGLHGSAGSGSLHALSCDTGLLLIAQNGDVPEIRHLPYSDKLPEGSASTLIGGKGLQYFVGNHGPDRIVLIDPSEQDAFRPVRLPARRVHFAVDPIRPKFVYVITGDGQLHQVDVLTGKIAHSLKLTEPYSVDGHRSDPRPRIAVAGDKVFVTDPLNGKIHIVEAQSFEKAGEITVEGKPFDIVAVGGTGKSHDREGEGAHDHEEGHAHN